MQEFEANGVKFSYYTAGQAFSACNAPEKSDGKPNQHTQTPILWAHGWGQSHAGFLKLIAPFESIAHHIALDLPGFGQSPPPPESWGTEDYADAIAAWMTSQNMPPVIWIGHSFGCRVGAQIASRHPECIKAMAFISGAGLKKKRPLHKKVYFYCRIKLFKMLRHLLPNGPFKDKVMNAFGSSDYKDSGAMRKIFVRVVNEDLSPQAQKITCPTTLIYGVNDTDTPPEFGERYSRLIRGSKLFLLENQDHYTVLDSGRHQVVKILNDFIKENT